MHGKSVRMDVSEEGNLAVQMSTSSEGSDRASSSSDSKDDKFFDSTDCCFCDEPNSWDNMIGCEGVLVSSGHGDSSEKEVPCDCWAHQRCNAKHGGDNKIFVCPIHFVYDNFGE